jgi:hypothetical protein
LGFKAGDDIQDWKPCLQNKTNTPRHLLHVVPQAGL